MFKLLIYIGLGSFLGGVSRYGVSKLMCNFTAIPNFLGTFAANILGCFLIGLFYGIFGRYTNINENWRLFLTVGFCGGFTTFSTFINENYVGMSQGHFLTTLLYTTLSFAIGLLALHFGHMLATRL